MVFESEIYEFRYSRVNIDNNDKELFIIRTCALAARNNSTTHIETKHHRFPIIENETVGVVGRQIRA